jgi:hypothetical protein
VRLQKITQDILMNHLLSGDKSSDCSFSVQSVNTTKTERLEALGTKHRLLTEQSKMNVTDYTLN